MLAITHNFLLKMSNAHIHRCKGGNILPFRESLECVVRSVFCGDEAQKISETTSLTDKSNGSIHNQTG